MIPLAGAIAMAFAFAGQFQLKKSSPSVKSAAYRSNAHIGGAMKRRYDGDQLNAKGTIGELLVLASGDDASVRQGTAVAQKPDLDAKAKLSAT